MNPPFSHVRRFCEAYFHDDWDLDDPTWEAVVERYVEHERADEVLAAKNELDDFTRLPDDVIERYLFDEWQTAHDPPESGMTTRDWLDRVRARFAEATKSV